MCLILLAWQYTPGTRMLLAANRDEYFRRPTRALHFWEEDPSILAGRDLEQGGSWLGITTSKRFAAVTNFREPSKKRPESVSRGLLVSEFLRSGIDPQIYLHSVLSDRHRYDPFNLLLGDNDDLYFLSSVDGRIHRLSPGIYGISNGELDCPWPKVIHGKSMLGELLDYGKVPECEALFSMLRDGRQFPDETLPDTGIGIAMERLVSPLFIHNGDYGTRSSAVLRINDHGEAVFSERSYDRDGNITGTVSFEI